MVILLLAINGLYREGKTMGKHGIWGSDDVAMSAKTKGGGGLCLSQTEPTHAMS